MYKTALRAPWYARPSRNLLKNPASRFLSTAPPAQKRRGWTNATVRWGVALGAVYLYSTSAVFAEEPEGAIRRFDDSIHAVQESNQPTLDAIVEEKRRRQAQEAADAQETERLTKAALAGDEEDTEVGEEGMGGLEEEAGSQGAFNPETGEINWDCPCLGGMAHGPCGEEFKAAFSCFVYSTEEPKGVECIDKFKGMQDCFRLHPEQYGAELEDEEDEIEQELLERQNASGKAEETLSEVPPAAAQEGAKLSQSKPKQVKTVSEEAPSRKKPTQSDEAPTSDKVEKPTQPKTTSEESPTGGQKSSDASASSDVGAASDKDDELIPKAAHDATRK